MAGKPDPAYWENRCKVAEKRCYALETALREAREAMLGVCKRHCLIKPDDMCVAEDCPASPYRTAGTEE